MIPIIKYTWDGYQVGAQNGDPWGGASNCFIHGMTGMLKGSDGNWTFDMGGLMRGLVPFVAFAGGGYLAHKAANKFGVNRHIPWFSL